MRFAVACLSSTSGLARSVAWHGVVFAKYTSVLGSNVLFSSKRYKWSPYEVLLNIVDKKKFSSSDDESIVS